MKPIKIVAASAFFVAAVSGSGAAITQEIGDWVLSPWQASRELYPGVIESRSGSTVTVRFDDGTLETRQAISVHRFNWSAGSRIACQWSNGQWYHARILSIASNGYNLRIRYDDDGVVENTTTALC
ncbi:MAG: hypothetical protein ACXIT4_04020 [Erythrobacter sp.]